MPFRYPSIALTALIAALLLVRCGGEPAPADSGAGPPRSLLLITLDTTRADHLEPYGAAGGATPALAELARRGLVFDRAYAVSPLTLPTHATMLTGLYPPQHGLRNNGSHHLPAAVETLAERLGERGLRTAAFVSAAVLERRYGLDQGFEVYDDDLGGRREARMVVERPAAATVDAARTWLDGLAGDEAFFLWVHLFDPHASYAPPPPFADRFADRPYAGEIAYMDVEIGRLLGHPRVASGTAVAAIADHGESLGEHGEKTHGLLAYEAVLHVPWILRIPGGPEGRRVAYPASQVDLVPTLLDLFGLPPEPELPGTSLLPRGTGAAERPLYAESLLPYFAYGWARLRVLRQGDWKYIEAPAAELYDLGRDPQERENLFDRRPEGRELARHLERLAAELGEAEATLTVDAATAERLRSLGYVSSTGGGRTESGGERPDPKAVIDLHHRLQQAEGLIGEGDLATAERLLREIRARDPGNLKMLDDLAQVLVARDRTEEAREVLEEALGLAPEHPALNLRLAELEARRGELEPALERARTARDHDPRSLPPWLVMADYLERLGRGGEIAALYREAREHLDGDPELHASFGRRLARRGEEAAETALRRALESGPRPELHNALGDFLAARGRTDEARREYERALGGGAEGREERHQRALALAALGRRQEAETLWRELHREEPDGAACTSLAALALERRDWRSAREWAERAVALAPGDAAAWNSLGFALDELGWTREALAAYERALAVDARYWQAAHNLGLLLLRGNDFGRAAAAFEEVLRQRPDHADAHFQLALLYAGPLGDPGRALDHLDACLESAPDHPRATQLRELRRRLEAALG